MSAFGPLCRLKRFNFDEVVSNYYFKISLFFATRPEEGELKGSYQSDNYIPNSINIDWFHFLHCHLNLKYKNEKTNVLLSETFLMINVMVNGLNGNLSFNVYTSRDFINFNFYKIVSTWIVFCFNWIMACMSVCVFINTLN